MNDQMNQLMVGIVRDNSDPDQMGRLKVFIPNVDSDRVPIEDLPPATYVTPFGGAARDLKVGREAETVDGLRAYGMWNVPKIGAQVLVAFLNGDPNFRIWLGCFYQPFNNFTLPGGKNSANGANGSGSPKSNDDKPITHMQKQLEKAGLLGRFDRTRGGWQRNVAEDLPHERTGKEGYHPNPNNTKATDSQVYSWTTPGGHYVVMDDSDTDCRVRIRTISGHQFILDDSNERIYISTGAGDNWLEFDEDGHVHLYGKQKISVRSESDINLISDKNVNIRAGQNVNVKAAQNINYEAGQSVMGKAVGGGMSLQAGATINIKAGGQLNAQSASTLNVLSGGGLNLQGTGPVNVKSGATVVIGGAAGVSLGTAAGPAGPASTVAALGLDLVVPAHEPWSRPATTKTRNKNWKE